jgi:hypothetical protein
MGIVGYLRGPLAGGGPVQLAGFAALGLVPLAADATLLALFALQMRRP